MYAIIKTGGKQYKVSEGDTLKVDKLEGVKDGEKVALDVLAVSDGATLTAGAPAVAGASVSAKVLAADAKGTKILVYKYKAKKNQRKRMGHRQRHTALKIEKITVKK